MKLKMRFPGLLLFLGRQNSLPGSFGNSPKDKREFKYMVWLLLLSFIALLMAFNKCNV